MPTTLPDCPHCDSVNTLSLVRAEPRGVRVGECSCCNAIVRVNVAGAIVHADRRLDVSGSEMTDP